MKIKTLCSVALLLTACFASAQTITRCGFSTTLYINWPTFHFDDCRTGFNPHEYILSPSTVGGLQVAWIFNTYSSAASSPALANGILYFPSRADNVGALSAVNANTGS